MRGIIALLATFALAACKPAPVSPQGGTPAAQARGQNAAARLGCGACHVIPDVWPAGRSGPSLEGFSTRGLIAGRLPNRPDTLAAFIRDPAALVPGTAMPRIEMTAAESRDIAAFLLRADAG